MEGLFGRVLGGGDHGGERRILDSWAEIREGEGRVVSYILLNVILNPGLGLWTKGGGGGNEDGV